MCNVKEKSRSNIEKCVSTQRRKAVKKRMNTKKKDKEGKRRKTRRKKNEKEGKRRKKEGKV